MILLIAGCARPMTEDETRFAKDLFGPSLDTSRVRVALGLGITPAHPTAAKGFVEVKATDKACVRTPQPRGAQPPQAFAFRDRVHFEGGLYSGDMAMTWPRALRIPHALIFAHELTHVWQWQNRAETGYSAARAVAESWRIADPYYAPPGTVDFWAYGFEQQAALVEDFVCFTLANPGHPRRQELRAILAPVFPVDRFEAAIRR